MGIEPLLTDWLCTETDEPEGTVARPLADWHEDYGPVVWWIWEADRNRWVGQPSHIGTPLDSDWIEDMYTHWTPHPDFPAPLPDAARAAVLARGPMPLLEALQDRPEMPPPVLRSDKRVAAPRCPTCDGSGVVSPAMSGRVSMSIGPCPDCAPPARGAS